MQKEPARALSPHLTIYKPQITSMLSIMHRASGAFLYLGLLLFSWFLISSKFTDTSILQCYNGLYISFFGSIFGKILAFLWTLAFFYHFCNGIRHLFWDAGKGLSLKSVTITGIIVILSSIFLSLFVWINGISKFL